jgi:hypothetical protein
MGLVWSGLDNTKKGMTILRNSRSNHVTGSGNYEMCSELSRSIRYLNCNVVQMQPRQVLSLLHMQYQITIS